MKPEKGKNIQAKTPEKQIKTLKKTIKNT